MQMVTVELYSNLSDSARNSVTRVRVYGAEEGTKEGEIERDKKRKQ